MPWSGFLPGILVYSDYITHQLVSVLSDTVGMTDGLFSVQVNTEYMI